MNLHFIPVRTAEDQELLAEAAEEIWREYWPSIIGEGQTEYMIQNFQSLEAIKRDMAKHDYEYWFLVAPLEEVASQESKADQIAEELAGSYGNGGKAWNEKYALVGYTGGHMEPETNRFFISKIYLFKEARGNGYARQAIEFYKALCTVRACDAMYLTVNKYNELGIRAYKGTGFTVIDSVETDIGDGFIMDDYVMELRLHTPF